MWIHTWVSFTSHTFTSLPLVHTPNPNFWGNVFNLASCWFANLLFMEAFSRHNLRTITSEFDPQYISEFRRFRFQIFSGSWLQCFAGSRFQVFADSRLQGFACSRFQIFADSRLRGFAGSRFQIFTMFNNPESSFHEICQTRRFEGERVFLNSATLMMLWLEQCNH
jgi:hypothetical protein